MIAGIPFVTLAISAVIVFLLALMAYRAIRYGGAIGVLHGANADLVGKTTWDSKQARMGFAVHRLRVKGKNEQDVVVELIIASSSTPLTVPREQVGQVIELLQKAISAMKKYNVGDKVVKNPETWIPNDFDSWGRGVGVGVVVEAPFELYDDEADVRWPCGRCFEKADQLLPYSVEEEL